MPQHETPTRIARRTATPLEVDAYETAVALLATDPMHLARLGRYLRDHAAAHLTHRYNAYLHGDAPTLTTEAAALAVVKGAARDLRAAASALHTAAARLRALGDAVGANRAYHAHREAEEAAAGLDPS